MNAEGFPQTSRISSGYKRVCDPETKPALNKSERTTRDLIVRETQICLMDSSEREVFLYPSRV